MVFFTNFVWAFDICEYNFGINYRFTIFCRRIVGRILININPSNVFTEICSSHKDIIKIVRVFWAAEGMNWLTTYKSRTLHQMISNNTFSSNILPYFMIYKAMFKSNKAPMRRKSKHSSFEY